MYLGTFYITAIFESFSSILLVGTPQTLKGFETIHLVIGKWGIWAVNLSCMMG